MKPHLSWERTYPMSQEKPTSRGLPFPHAQETLLQVLPSQTALGAENFLADIELTDQTIAVYQQIVRPHDIHDPIVKGLAKAKRRNQLDSEGFFVFPTKSARPTTPTPVLEPIPTQNNFENLEKEPEPMIDSSQENVSPIIKPPYPITLKTDKNYRDQLKEN
ncbi:hypothetical protein TNCV_3879811 [Trichonephila clavipes]|nr:hypothetical protein TNCV_3879811 [Trichonephila clavipes]